MLLPYENAAGGQPQRALSIMQPWAHLIVTGAKDIENRDWSTRFRGPVLIHAGKKYDGERGEASCMGVALPDHFDMGGIVGEAEIVDCVTESSSPWFFGKFGFVLRNARPLPFRPCRGQLVFFTPDFSIVAAPAPVAAREKRSHARPRPIDPQADLFKEIA